MSGAFSESILVVDSNVILRLLWDTRDGPYSRLVNQWLESGIDLLAPYLLGYEVTNAIWQDEKIGNLSSELADEAVERFTLLPIKYFSDLLYHHEALLIARRFKRDATYDAHFLALAMHHECEFWTCDKKLWNAVHKTYPWVRLIDEPFAKSHLPKPD